MRILRPFFRYCIDRAVDRGRPLRGITAWFVARDARLRHYESRIRAVDLRLRQDLDAHLERPCTEQFTSQVPREISSRTPTASQATLAKKVPISLLALAVALLLVFSTVLLFSPPNSDKNPHPLAGHDPGATSNETLNPEPEKTHSTVPDGLGITESVYTEEDVPIPFPDLADLQEFLRPENRDSLNEILTILGRIPRPAAALPLPSREAVYDSLSASNPVCSYLIECYVRPAFEDDARHLHNSEKNPGKL